MSFRYQNDNFAFNLLFECRVLISLLSLEALKFCFRFFTFYINSELNVTSKLKVDLLFSSIVSFTFIICIYFKIFLLTTDDKYY